MCVRACVRACVRVRRVCACLRAQHAPAGVRVRCVRAQQCARVASAFALWASIGFGGELACS